MLPGQAARSRTGTSVSPMFGQYVDRILAYMIAASLLASVSDSVPASSDCCSYWMPRVIPMDSSVKFRDEKSVQAIWSGDGSGPS
jgi:hypothetical protein